MTGPWKRLAVGAAVIVAVRLALTLVFLLSRASATDSALVGLPLDDGWIHLVYARNLAVGHEVAYNPGEPEVGLTSPLWVLLESPFATLGGPGPAVAAKVQSALWAVAACLLAAWLARELAGDAAGLAAGLAAAIDPAFSASAVSGMEVALTATLMLAALLALRRRAPLLAGAAAGLAWLARPETAALLAVLGPWAAVLVRRGELRAWRAVGGAALALAMAAPFALLCLRVAGRPLPNTFYVKAALELAPWDGLRTLAIGVLLPSVVVGLGAGLALALGGARWLVTQRSADGVAVVAAPLAFVVAVLASRGFAAGEESTYYYTRYLHPALPLVAVWIGCGAGALASRWSAKKKRRRTRARALAIAAAIAVAAWAAIWMRVEVERFSWSTRNIEEMQVAAGRWIAAETPRDAVIAASDAGAVRFFGRRRVIDLMALNYRRGIEARRAGRVPLGQIMRDERPSYLAVLPSWFPGLERGGRAREVFVGRAERYEVAAARQDRFVVYEVLLR